jgi:hypothetical protein
MPKNNDRSPARRRRIIYNDDSDQQFTRLSRYDITDDQSFVDARTTPTFDTQVDTYVWCVGNGADPPWGNSGYVVRPCLRSLEHANDVIVQACHDKEMEVWASLRLNDLHDASLPIEESFDPFKAEHPEYLLGNHEVGGFSPERIERFFRTALNYEHPEVRRHFLDFIARNAAAHDFDGYELDFSRWIWTFPLGRERALAPLMTEFVRGTRELLNGIAADRGRPYTLVAHVMDSIETSLSLGQDVRTWVADGLVDVLVVGMGHRPFGLALDEWRELRDRYGTPIYPSLNTLPLRRFHNGELRPESAWAEYIRGTAAWWRKNNADGIYLFNLFAHESRLDKSVVYEPLSEIGEAATLVGRDKLYGIGSNALGGDFSMGLELALLPIPLDIHERRLPLPVGPDADQPGASFKIHAWTKGGASETRILMRVNHTLLDSELQESLWAADVPTGLLHPGLNELTIWCDTPLDATTNPIIVTEIVLSVIYEEQR